MYLIGTIVLGVNIWCILGQYLGFLGIYKVSMDGKKNNLSVMSIFPWFHRGVKHMVTEL